jgi:hypothetical protein
VLDDERALADPPERLASLQIGDLLDLDLGQAEQLAGLLDLAVGLAVDDPGLRVLEQSLGQLDLLAALVAGRGQVAEPVHHGHALHAVAAGQLPALAQPAGDGQVAQDHPGLVEHHDAVDTVVAGPGALEPGRGAGHEDGAGGVLDLAQVEGDDLAGQVQPGRGGPVEHAAQVAGAHAAQPEPELAAVLGQPLGARAQLVGRVLGRAEQPLDDLGDDRLDSPLGRLAGDLGVGPLQGGVLLGGQGPPEHDLGDRAQQHELGVAADHRVQRVQAQRPAADEPDRLGPAHLGQGVVLTLGIDDPGRLPEQLLTPEDGLHERALGVADLPEDQHVGAVDALVVQLPRVEAERAAVQVPADVDAP